MHTHMSRYPNQLQQEESDQGAVLQSRSTETLIVKKDHRRPVKNNDMSRIRYWRFEKEYLATYRFDKFSIHRPVVRLYPTRNSSIPVVLLVQP